MAGHILWKRRWLMALWFTLFWTYSEQLFPPRIRNVPKDTAVSIPEDAGPGQFIFNVFASDADDPRLTFTVINPKNLFEFDQKSLRTSLTHLPITEFYINLTTTGRQPGLDYETSKEHNVTIQVADLQTKVLAFLTVKVLNVNDNPPTLTVTKSTVIIGENAAIGTSLDYVMSFSDNDVSDVVFVGLKGEDANLMNINPSTGAITLNSLIDVDPNNEFKVYNPIIFASDGTFTSSATLTLTVRDVNDNPPECNPTTIQAEVQEELPGSRVVATLSCTDRDSAWNNNNKLIYTILKGNSTLFRVDEAGALNVLSPLDYEKSKSETIILKVEDRGLSGHLSTTVTVSLTIKPINNIAPVWKQWIPDVPPNLTYTVSENAPIGTSILTIAASDADLDIGNDLTYSMIVTTTGGVPQQGQFNLDSLNGLFSVRSTLERDGPQGISQYSIIFQASDGVHTINRTITLVVKDYNDNSPRFLGTPYPTVTLREEDARSGALITKLTATDDDASTSTLTYAVTAILSGNTVLSDWRFNPTIPGQLELAAGLDLDRDNPPAPVSVLQVQVRDNGIPELSGTTTLTVEIIPDNEFSPTVVSQPGTVEVSEDAPIRTRVVQIVASDNDKGQEGLLVYSITAGNTGQAFRIDSNGWISTQITLDRETMSQFILTILISDSAVNNARSVTATVTILVTDVDDNIPSCLTDVQSVALLENSTINTIVTSISCSDEDTDDVLSASVKPPLNSIFGFSTPKISARSRATWELKLLQGVDYDSNNQVYNLDVSVSDGKNIIPVSITVSLIAVNEFRPTFQTNPTVNVLENVVKSPLIVYQASDLDYSPHDIISYKINSVSNNGASRFNIDTRTGKLDLLSPLDYEELPIGDKTYKVVVVAEDGGGLQGTGTVTIVVEDVNDNSPVCKSSTLFQQVPEKHTENGPYSVVPDLDCSDLENGKNLAYSLTQAPGDHFILANGGILLRTDSLDYETSPTHILTVKVTDKGVPSLTSTVTIYITVTNQNDGGPVFTSQGPASVSEAAVIGQFVADVVATDPDGNDPEFGDIQYSIISGDSQSQFFIDAQTGRLSTRRKLDFETIPTYRLVIQAKEKRGPNSATMTQVVNVLDVNDEKPVCVNTSFVVTVLETKPVDYTVIDLSCQDTESNTALTYSIASGNTAYFKMQGPRLILKKQLDFESLPTTNDLTILVSDTISSHDVFIYGTVLTGSVDEGPPTFDRATYITHVLENLTVYSNIFTMVASDPDSPQDENGQIKYSFQSSNYLFSIDTTSGQVFLAGSLDREKEATHTLVVRAADALGQSTATLSVLVDDVNDNAPRCKSSVYRGAILGSDPPGTTVLTVQATDADDPNFNKYGSILYQLTGNSDFSINANTGVISNTFRLDTKNGSRIYSLTVQVTDSNGGPGFLSGSCVVNIQVTTSNKHVPVFSQPSYSVTVKKNQYKINDVILSVAAQDDDVGPDGELTLNLISADNNFYLSQTGNTGQIRLLRNLDFDSGDTEFTFEVTATDRGSPSQTGTCIVTILVDDTNDKAPLCPRYINLDKVEGETYLTKIVCSGIDGSRPLIYTITGVTPANIQPVISKEGVLTTQRPLDYELAKFYQITIQVKDSGPPVLNMNIVVRLHVIDVNDNDPTFIGPLTFDLPEDTTSKSSVLYTVQADGNDDQNDVITYSLLDDTYFYITSDTGEISLIAEAPDYETVGGIYTLGVCISDTPNPVARTACSNITVNILDSNDEAPTFPKQVYQVTVPEDSTVGKSLITLAAFDKDVSPQFKNIVYSITDGNSDSCFRILSNGVIDLTKKLDYEKTQFYTITVQASDGIHNTTAQVYITVTPVNEHTPLFPVPNITVHTEENVPTGTIIFTAVATDSDGGNDGVVRYKIDKGPFVIDPLFGNVSVIGSLDRESSPLYNLNIFAIDQGMVAKTGTLHVTIIIDDVNDNSPTCETSSFVVLVAESVTSNDIITTLNCEDDDDDPAGLNNALSFTIYSTPSDIFTIDPSGNVKLKVGAILDRETVAAYAISVTVSDKGTKIKLSTTVTFSLTVTDVNDNDPYFTSLQPVIVPEDTTPGAVITTIKAADKDEGINKELIFEITNGNPSNFFSLNPTSGDLILSKLLDFETQQLHQLVITVKDRGTPPRSITGTMNITVSDTNDNPPKCPTAINPLNVWENSTNEIIKIITCNDSDVAGFIVYSITRGNDGNFTINANTGAVSTKPNAHLDFETIQSYVLEITASDGRYSDMAYLKINILDVNEFPPKFTPPLPVNIFVPEDALISSVIYEFKATDQDTSDSVKIFSIVDGNSAQRFSLNQVTGKLLLHNLLDYENETSYTLTVAVHDSDGLSDTVKFDVSVTDVNDNTPTCQNKSVTVSVLEGIKLNQIYTPSCSDADKKASPVLEYSLPAGSHKAFMINSNTGQLSLQEPLDYEIDTLILLTIVVKEKGITSPRETSISVQIIVEPVNEFDPVFQPTNIYGPYNVSENTVTGTIVAQVTATDADKGLNDGIVQYAIFSGDPQEYFYIDESRGEIRLTRQLNRKFLKEFTLTLTASDSVSGSDRSRSATATVKLVITDVNDHRPQLIPPTYSLNVSETSRYGASVVLAYLIVQDEDEGDNSVISITITSGNRENKFAIVDQNLILVGQLDYETTNFYDLFLDISDRGKPPLSSSGRVRIKVLPENEASPRMDKLSENLTVPENSPLGTLIYKASATDTDSELHGQITYSFDGYNPTEFLLNPSTGQLYVNAPLDYDTQPNTYTVAIRATDGVGASDPVTSIVTLRIILSDLNDNAPKCSSQVINMTVRENVAIETQIGVLVATDADSTKNGEVKYSLTGGSGQSYFNVDSISGKVTTSKEIDYETFQIFYLTVMASDGGTPSLTSNCLIKVDVTNMNDNYPVISPQNFTITVPESIANGETIMTYSTSDQDNGISSISLVFTSPYFEVTSKDNAVRTKSLLRDLNVKIHKIYIQVVDMATQADPTTYSSTATLTIYVTSEDNGLVINGDYNTSIPENIAINEIIFKINATDKNYDQLSGLTYDIRDGNIGGAFSIDSKGNIQVARTLDRETIPNYVLTIVVVDNDLTTPTEAETQAYVTVTDVNDNSPTFNQGKYTFSVADRSPIGFQVGALQATDADIGRNAELTFEFDSFSVGKRSDFSLHPSSGVITVASSSLSNKINPTYVAKVKVKDAGFPIRSSFAVVTINITDYSNHEPVFEQATYSVSLDERAPTGTNILQLYAVDNDIGDNGKLSYFMDMDALDGSTAKQYIQVNKSNGNIFTIDEVNYEEYKEFRIAFVAIDNGSPPLSGNTTVIVSIYDINDYNPYFRPTFYNVEVAYNGQCNNSIATLSAFDDDADKNGEVSYYLRTGPSYSFFEVIPSSGELKLKTIASPNAGYKLEVRAEDAGQPVRTSLNPAKIRVDTFVPDDVVVVFRLGISRKAFFDEIERFLEMIEEVVHTKYPAAVVRLWCVMEYDGIAISPVTSFRRLLADQPVDANVYALKDNSTESELNFNKSKEFLPQNEFLALFADNPEGDPNSNVQGARWNYLNITSVKSYKSQDDSSKAESHIMIIIIIAIIIGLILFTLMLCLLLRFCCRSFGDPKFRKQKVEHLYSVEFKKGQKNSGEVKLNELKGKPNEETEMAEFKRKNSVSTDFSDKKSNLEDLDSMATLTTSSKSQLPLPRFAVVRLYDKIREESPDSLLYKSYLGQSNDNSNSLKNQTLRALSDTSHDSSPSDHRAVVITIKNPMDGYNNLNAQDSSTTKNNQSKKINKL